MPRLNWGDAGHTGPLTDYAGSYDIDSTSPVVLENFRFTSELRQEPECPSLTVRNCHFDLAGTRYGFQDRWTDSPNTVTIIEDCTFEGGDSAAVIFGGSGAKVLRRCQFRDFRTDFVKFFGSGTKLVEDCYFGGLSRSQVSGEDYHADAFQNTDSGTNTIRRNTFATPPSTFASQFRTVTPGSWLESDAQAVGVTGPIYYKGSITYFTFLGATSTTRFEENHFVEMGHLGIRMKDDVAATCRYELADNVFYPSGIVSPVSGTSEGVWVDEGKNVWAESGNDLNGTARQQGYSIFTGLLEGLPDTGGGSSALDLGTVPHGGITLALGGA